MADSLLAPPALSNFLGEDLDLAQETALLEQATAIVQDAAGQRLVRVENDEVTLIGSAEHWLTLPERPVVSVSAVEIDGNAVTDFQVRKHRLWRDQGWQASSLLLLWSRAEPPSLIDVTYTHGYDDNDQALEFARSVVKTVAAQLNGNPLGATGFSIDDYREQYSQAGSAAVSGAVPESLRLALRRRYGLRTGMLTAA